MHERLIKYFNSHAGVHWVTLAEIANDFARRQPRTREERPGELKGPGERADTGKV
jgi:peptidoglycan-N-acetylglucosamine deacetylase